MTFTSKHVILIVTLSLLLLPGISTPSLSDFEWGTEEGRRIAYTYHGASYNRVNVSGTIEIVETVVEEDIYFRVDDLSSYPIPTIEGISVTPFWYNSTPFEDSDNQELGWYIDNIGLIDEIAVRVGNWTVYDELAQEYWRSREFGDYIVTATEISRFWNITLEAYWPENYLVGVTFFSYAKDDGKLQYGYHKRCSGNESAIDLFLGLTIHNYAANVGSYIFIIGSVGAVGIIVIFVRAWRISKLADTDTGNWENENY